jgi:hypothetical protein
VRDSVAYEPFNSTPCLAVTAVFWRSQMAITLTTRDGGERPPRLFQKPCLKQLANRLIYRCRCHRVRSFQKDLFLEGVHRDSCNVLTRRNIT